MIQEAKQKYTKRSQPKSSKPKTKIVIATNQRFLLLIIIVALIGFGIYRTIGVLATATVTEPNELYSYRMNADSTYVMELQPHAAALYPEGKLEENMLYPNLLVSQMMLSVKADYSGSLPATIKGVYNVTAHVQGFQGSNESMKIIYEKQFPILNANLDDVQGEAASITRNIALNLEPYREFANSADIILGARPSRRLQLVFSGSFTAETEHGPVEAPFTHTVTLPISSGSELFAVTKDSPVADTGGITGQKESIQLVNPLQVVMAIFWVVLGLLALLFVLLKTRTPSAVEKAKQVFYSLERKYASRMIKLTDLPVFPENKTLKLADTGSLIKVADEFQRPICYVPESDGMPRNKILYVDSGTDYYCLELSLPEVTDEHQDDQSQNLQDTTLGTGLKE